MKDYTDRIVVEQIIAARMRHADARRLATECTSERGGSARFGRTLAGAVAVVAAPLGIVGRLAQLDETGAFRA